MVKALTQNAEHISALVDGDLQDQALASTLAELSTSESARERWDTYHLVGDVMRSAHTPVRAHDPTFVLKLRQRLAQEEIKIVAVDAISMSATAINHASKHAANEPYWRRVVGLVSVALAAVFTWQLVPWQSSTDAAPQLAQRGQSDLPVASAPQVLIRSDGSSALVLNAEPQVMLRDPQLDALLAAHRQLAGTSTLQTSAGFLHQATFAGSAR